MNIQETVTILAKAATVDRWLNGGDAQLLVWHEVLGKYTFEEVNSALMALLAKSDKVSPSDLAGIVRTRRDMYAMSHPDRPSVEGLSWDHTLNRYLDAESGGPMKELA